MLIMDRQYCRRKIGNHPNKGLTIEATWQPCANHGFLILLQHAWATVLIWMTIDGNRAAILIMGSIDDNLPTSLIMDSQYCRHALQPS
jgi:hypothetical protein